MTPAHSPSASRRGLTLIEVMIAVSILSLMIVSITRAGDSASRLFKTSVSRVTLEQRLRQSIGKIRGELELSSSDLLDSLGDLPLWTTTASFDRIDGIDERSGEGNWRTMRFELRMDDGETDDGTDEDGDGVVDERMLMLILDFGTAEAMELVLVHGVRENFPGEEVNGVDDNENGLIDESGFVLYARDEAVHVLLALEGVDSEGRTIVRSVTTATRVRN
ncbi:MAG: prepilin-type N-terminal cleavage/methylation domain-containing protein [Planctomycetota bacterium]|jgi:prepilin-type N-terminal cleavage/methylation domain-containing protein